MPERHDDDVATGRARRPGDSVPGASPAPRFLEGATVKVGHALGEGIDRSVRSRHRVRLRLLRWERALTASRLGFARGGFPARAGNTLDVLVDGSEVLPAIAKELSTAQSYVYLRVYATPVVVARVRHWI